MLTDPISDFLTRIRNGMQARHAEVSIPASGLKKELARILVEQGYVASFEVEPDAIGETIRVKLRYSADRQPLIRGLERVSRPGRRRYVGAGEIPRVRGGMGTAIVSTSHGVMTGHDARKKGVGGEVVAYVW